MLKMVDGTGIIGLDMVCPLGGTVSPPQPPNYDKVEVEGVGSLVLPNSLKAPLERVELLGNSVQGENPSPDNPQEIKSAGRKSKNLFDINYFKDRNNLQTIQCEGFSLLGIICNLKPNTEYTLSANLTEAKYNLNIANKTKRFSLTSAPSRTLVSNDDGTLYIGFYSPTADLINMDDFMQQYKNIQLEEGNKTAYEPYSDKYLLDVKVNGKNIFNKNAVKQGYEFGAMLSDAETVKQGWFVSDFMPVKATTYQISGKKTGAGCKLYSKDKVFVKNIQAPFGGIKFEEGIAYFGINGEIKDLDKVQVEEGNVVTPHEPYTEQSVQIALDEPLRGVGEYKDTITKDGVIRKIKRIVFDENTPFKEYNAPVQVKTTSFISGTTIKDATSETGIEVMSDRFKAKDRGFDRYDEECITLFGRSIFVRFNKDKNINTEEALTEWLKQNPLTVDYVLAEPVTEPLPESVQAQLSALHSENGTTHVFVDSGEVEAGIKLTYRKEK